MNRPTGIPSDFYQIAYAIGTMESRRIERAMHQKFSGKDLGGEVFKVSTNRAMGELAKHQALSIFNPHETHEQRDRRLRKAREVREAKQAEITRELAEQERVKQERLAREEYMRIAQERANQEARAKYLASPEGIAATKQALPTVNLQRAKGNREDLTKNLQLGAAATGLSGGVAVVPIAIFGAHRALTWLTKSKFERRIERERREKQLLEDGRRIAYDKHSNQIKKMP